MAKEKKETKVKETKKAPEIYEGYDIRLLKEEPDHPNYYLVAEYEAKYGEAKY